MNYPMYSYERTYALVYRDHLTYPANGDLKRALEQIRAVLGKEACERIEDYVKSL